MLQTILDHCSAKPGATKDFPFDEKILAFRLMGKMFALINMQTRDRINLKCDPELALALRQQYPGVIPGYHMNKKHWNTVSITGDIPVEEIITWIDHSYELIFNGLKKADRDAIRPVKK